MRFISKRWGNVLNPNYALEAERTNALVGIKPDLATLGFHQKGFYDSVKTKVLFSRCEAEKMLLHFWVKVWCDKGSS